MTDTNAPVSYDPYDLWMTSPGVFAKKHFYRGRIIGKLLSVAIGLADWLTPNVSRAILGAKKRSYPITVAQWILGQSSIADSESALRQLMAVSSTRKEEFGNCWGLGFPWMSKNGLYDENMPFVTHTPYALEALVKLFTESGDPGFQEKARNCFLDSRPFLDGLKIMHQGETSLALSYAPIEEPRIVVNANSYAGYSYALHAKFGENSEGVASARCKALLHWVVEQQQENGSWYYYADEDAGNFIDGFHSCFVLKNLIKSAELIPELKTLIEPAVVQGMSYLQKAFIDQKTGLLRRFTERDIKDPFVWDLYDQAEYLGLLVLLGKLDEADTFIKVVYQHFHKKGHWYCRKDFFGRLWGKDFLRWGIMPFIHQQHEYQQAIEKERF